MAPAGDFRWNNSFYAGKPISWRSFWGLLEIPDEYHYKALKVARLYNKINNEKKLPFFDYYVLTLDTWMYRLALSKQPVPKDIPQ